MLHLMQEACTPVPPGPKRKQADSLVYTWATESEERANEFWKIQRRKELEALQMGITEAGGLKLICCYDQQSKVWRGTSLGAHERIRCYLLICNSNILEEKICKTENVVFHRLITDFEENALGVNDSEGRRRARLYQDEA